MPIEFRCTRCYTLLRTKEEAAGRQFNCPRCGETLTVPGPEGGTPETLPTGGGAEAFVEGGPKQPAGAPTTWPSGEANPYQAPASTEAVWQPPPRPGASGPAIASLVLGICSLPALCCCGVFGLPIAAIGLILGIVGLKAENNGVAVAGIVVNSIAMALLVLVGLMSLLALLA
jgi:phage FluMu protein Com